jgi:gamma-glutamyltranspeptidase/glutathione hydrolase
MAQRFTQNFRPVVRSRRGVVASGHYLATSAGLRVLAAGGNAVDAAAAVCFCLNQLEPHQNGTGGEVPTLIYDARTGRTHAVGGMGISPGSLDIAWFRERGIDMIPGDGFLPACVPAVVGTWALAVAEFGRLRFADILQPAIDLARDGFPVDEGLAQFLHANARRFRERYPTTAAVYLPGGEPPAAGALLRNPDYARTLTRLAEAEAACGGSRGDGIRAACNAFYRGPIAAEMTTFAAANPVADASGSAHAGMLTPDDFAAWSPTLEAPLTLAFRGLDVHKCPTWTQGLVFLQQLALLDGALDGLSHNSDAYLHLLIESAKLGFADRERFYGDPALDNVPVAGLLAPAYAADRRALIGDAAASAFAAGTPAGSVRATIHDLADVRADNRAALGLCADAAAAGGMSGDPNATGDTTQLAVVDGDGNMVAATPSGGWLATSPVIPGIGFPFGTRGQMFYLNGGRPNALAPRKRPRATLTPSLVTRGGAPWMVFGTPGGDAQDQWTLQAFLNHVVFDMDLQSALDAPTVHCQHFPSSFYPRTAQALRVAAEARIPESIRAALASRGHDIAVAGDWVHGKPMAIRHDADSGVISGAVTVRGTIGQAAAW